MKYVAFFDILGFKDLTTHNSHSELIKIYQSLLGSVNQAIANQQYIHNSKLNILTPDIQNSIVNSFIISDSILLWTDNNSPSDLIKITQASNVLLLSSFLRGLPLRGAIEYGEFSFLQSSLESNMNNQIGTFLGKVIADLFNLEKLQEWSGGIISKEIYQNHPQLIAETMLKKNFICDYSPPLKETSEKEYYSIHWASSLKVDNTFSAKDIFTMHKKNISLCHNKVVNTENYLKKYDII